MSALVCATHWAVLVVPAQEGPGFILCVGGADRPTGPHPLYDGLEFGTVAAAEGFAVDHGLLREWRPAEAAALILPLNAVTQPTDDPESRL